MAGVTEKLQGLNDVEFSKLLGRMQSLIDKTKSQFNAGSSTTPAFDDDWVRKELMPVIEKIANLKK
jgi:hypothetical protein